MNPKRLLPLAAMLLCLCMALSSCFLYDFEIFGITPPTENTVEEQDTRLVPFSEMEYERPDVDAILAKLTELTGKVETAANIDALMALDEEATALVNDFSTMSSLAEVHTYLDVNDEYYDTENRYCSEHAVVISNHVNTFNAAIINSPLADEYRAEVGDYSFGQMETQQLLNSPEVEAYIQERNALDADYNKKLTSLTVTYDGKEYTMEDIQAAADESYALYIRLLTEYYKTNAVWFADTYARMVELDKLTAETLGFAGAAEMYYLSYSRDYTPNEALALTGIIKEKLVPLGPQVDYYGNYQIDIPYRRAFAGIPKIVGSISPELTDYWNTMVDYGLEDYEARPEKQSGIGFTTSFPSYDASFCYGYYEGDFFSASTVIHEFGHFYDGMLHDNNDGAFCLDVLEVYSQGLEVLAQPYYSDMMDRPEDGVRKCLASFMETFLYQSLLEEFQLRAYELDEITPESLGGLYADLFEEYGYGDYILADENGNANNWFEVTHIFDAPFYTISYVTSANVAMQIWRVAQTSQDTAVTAYMNMIHEDQAQPFEDLVQSVGLKSPMDPIVWDWMEDIYKSEFSGASFAA